jgi:hypothetical protein
VRFGEKRKEEIFAVRLTGLEECGARRGAGNGGKSENGENDARNTRRKPARRMHPNWQFQIKHHAARLRALRTEYPEFFD